MHFACTPTGHQAVTPGSGYMDIQSACVVGLLGGIMSYLWCHYAKPATGSTTVMFRKAKAVPPVLVALTV